VTPRAALHEEECVPMAAAMRVRRCSRDTREAACSRERREPAAHPAVQSHMRGRQRRTWHSRQSIYKEAAQRSEKI